MHPDFWGPSGWLFLHSITFEYPTLPTEIEKKYYIDFFTNIQYVLPCTICSHHYSNHLVKYPLTEEIMKTKKNLVEWLIHIHNEVNKSLGKPVLQTNEVINIYNKKIHEKRYSDDYTEYIPYIIICISIIFMIYLYNK